MANTKQINKLVAIFTEQNNIKGFNSDTMQQISKINHDALVDLVCNLVEAYYEKETNEYYNSHRSFIDSINPYE